MADGEAEEGERRDGADPAAPAAGAQKSLLKRLLPYLMGGVLSIGLGIGAGIVQSHRHETQLGKPSGDEKTPSPDDFPTKSILELPEQIFNCNDTGQLVAGKIKIALEIRTTPEWGEGEKKSALQALIESKDERFESRIKDSLLSLYSSKVSTDLKTARGKEILKLEILAEMNRIIFSGDDAKKDPKGVATGVLWLVFLVQ